MKSILNILILCFFSNLICVQTSKAQQYIKTIFNKSKVVIDSLENLDNEIVYLGFDVLSQTENSEEFKYFFDNSLEYSIMSYGSENITEINLQVFKIKNNQNSILRTGQNDGTDKRISSINFRPEQSEDFVVKIIGEEFASGKSNGRYFLIIGNKESVKPWMKMIKYREVGEYDPYDEKFNMSNKSAYSCTFIREGKMIQLKHENGLHQYSIVENATSSEDLKKMLVVFKVKDNSEVFYRMIIDMPNKVIEIKQITILSGEKTVPVVRYYY